VCRGAAKASCVAWIIAKPRPPMETLPPRSRNALAPTPACRSRGAQYTPFNEFWNGFRRLLWQPVSRASDNDPNAPMARYRHPRHQRTVLRTPILPTTLILPQDQHLNGFRCSTDGASARRHQSLRRYVLSHELAVPWRDEVRAAANSRRLKDSFFTPNSFSRGRGAHNDAQSQSRLYHAQLTGWRCFTSSPACAPGIGLFQLPRALDETATPRRSVELHAESLPTACNG